MAGNATASSTADTDGSPTAGSFSLGPAANATATGGIAMSGTGGSAIADATASDTASVPPTGSLGANAVATATGGALVERCRRQRDRQRDRLRGSRRSRTCVRIRQRHRRLGHHRCGRGERDVVGDRTSR